MYDDSLSTKTLYAAEDNVAKAIKRGGTADFFGSSLDLRQCAIRTYTPDQLPIMTGVVAGLYAAFGRGVRQQPPTLRLSKRAYARAWYSPAQHEIVLPAREWAFTDIVLCHEVAHACTGCGHDQRSAHGHPWRKTYCAIVAAVVGPEAGLLMRAALDL